MSRRIGILGGSFDPIHCGHIDLAMAAEATLGLARLFVIPASVSPHRSQTYASGFHRFAMAALTAAGRPGWRASDLELRSDGPSYTYATLQRFHERGYAPGELFFIIGADAFADITSWRDYPAILDAANFAVVARSGHAVETLPQRLTPLAGRMVHPPIERIDASRPAIILINAVTADVSSTAIRRLCAERRPITGLVDLGVQQHIEQHGLYRAQVPGRRGSDSPADSAAGRLHGQS